MQAAGTSRLPPTDDFSGLDTDTAVPTEEDYVVYDEGVCWFSVLFGPFAPHQGPSFPSIERVIFRTVAKRGLAMVGACTPFFLTIPSCPEERGHVQSVSAASAHSLHPHSPSREDHLRLLR